MTTTKTESLKAGAGKKSEAGHVSPPDTADDDTPFESPMHLLRTKQARLADALSLAAYTATRGEETVFNALALDALAEKRPDSLPDGMLTVHMAGLHVQITSTMHWLNKSGMSLKQREALGKLLNGYLRTFATLAETQRRLANGPSQTVRVEHVTVEAGGQAIVGNVERGGGEGGSHEN